MYVAGSNRLAEYGNGQWQGIVDDPTIGEIGPAPTSTIDGAAARPLPARLAIASPSACTLRSPLQAAA